MGRIIYSSHRSMGKSDPHSSPAQPGCWMDIFYVVAYVVASLLSVVYVTTIFSPTDRRISRPVACTTGVRGYTVRRSRQRSSYVVLGSIQARELPEALRLMTPLPMRLHLVGIPWENSRVAAGGFCQRNVEHERRCQTNGTHKPPDVRNSVY